MTVQVRLLIGRYRAVAKVLSDDSEAENKGERLAANKSLAIIVRNLISMEFMCRMLEKEIEVRTEFNQNGDRHQSVLCDDKDRDEVKSWPNRHNVYPECYRDFSIRIRKIANVVFQMIRIDPINHYDRFIHLFSNLILHIVSGPHFIS